MQRVVPQRAAASQPIRQCSISAVTAGGFILCGDVWVKEERIAAFRKSDNDTTVIYLDSGHVVSAKFSTENGRRVWMNNVLGENRVRFRNDFEDEMYKKYLEDKLDDKLDDKLEDKLEDKAEDTEAKNSIERSNEAAGKIMQILRND